eukprot:TRINITY_DN5886_c2_g1_i1.p1 TRINITY_DN5886_c2_g1~~TRINITY_DN5886_c2_g1_i1.p1  ORF type:complete len:104 (-),score=4.84 TRINITY_DN5886_c2_g1_i1:200-511(-)
MSHVTNLKREKRAFFMYLVYFFLFLLNLIFYLLVNQKEGHPSHISIGIPYSSGLLFHVLDSNNMLNDVLIVEQFPFPLSFFIIGMYLYQILNSIWPPVPCIGS